MNLKISKVKIFVTVPLENVEDVRIAVCEAGGGVIGNYRYCTYSVKGVGTFMPNNSAKPYIGESGKLEYVEEEKLEVLCEVEKVKQVVKAIRNSHPYEEPAIDIVPLMDEDCFK